MIQFSDFEPIIRAVRTGTWIKDSFFKDKTLGLLEKVSKIHFETAKSHISNISISNNPSREAALAINSLQTTYHSCGGIHKYYTPKKIKTFEQSITVYACCIMIASLYKALGEENLLREWVDLIEESHHDVMDAYHRKAMSYIKYPLIISMFLFDKSKEIENNGQSFHSNGVKIAEQFGKEIDVVEFQDRLVTRRYIRAFCGDQSEIEGFHSK